jgi:hypothetical protein
MNVDNLIEKKSCVSAWSRIKDAVFQPEVFIAFIMILIIVATFAYMASVYESCDGTVVKGPFGGLECIEGR